MFDMKKFSRLKKLDENAPHGMKAFRAFDRRCLQKRRQHARAAPLGFAICTTQPADRLSCSETMLF
jgi:hypothetical protein